MSGSSLPPHRNSVHTGYHLPTSVLRPRAFIVLDKENHTSQRVVRCSVVLLRRARRRPHHRRRVRTTDLVINETSSSGRARLRVITVLFFFYFVVVVFVVRPSGNSQCTARTAQKCRRRRRVKRPGRDDSATYRTPFPRPTTSSTRTVSVVATARRAPLCKHRVHGFHGRPTRGVGETEYGPRASRLISSRHFARFDVGPPDVTTRRRLLCCCCPVKLFPGPVPSHVCRVKRSCCRRAFRSSCRRCCAAPWSASRCTFVSTSARALECMLTAVNKCLQIFRNRCHCGPRICEYSSTTQPCAKSLTWLKF